MHVVFRVGKLLVLITIAVVATMSLRWSISNVGGQSFGLGPTAASIYGVGLVTLAGFGISYLMADKYWDPVDRVGPLDRALFTAWFWPGWIICLSIYMRVAGFIFKKPETAMAVGFYAAIVQALATKSKLMGWGRD